jgi:hypothetical protein
MSVERREAGHTLDVPFGRRPLKQGAHKPLIVKSGKEFRKYLADLTMAYFFR